MAAGETVTIADLHPGELPEFLAPWRGGRLQTVALDARNEADAAAVMQGHAAVMCALPYYFNEPMTRAAIASGAHFSDLGGNTAIVQDSSRTHMPPEEVARLQRHYVEQGDHPRVVAEDIANGVLQGKGTILSGKGVGKVAFMKRLLPRTAFRKLLIDASRKMGYMPLK